MPGVQRRSWLSHLMGRVFQFSYSKTARMGQGVRWIIWTFIINAVSTVTMAKFVMGFAVAG